VKTNHCSLSSQYVKKRSTDLNEETLPRAKRAASVSAVNKLAQSRLANVELEQHLELEDKQIDHLNSLEYELLKDAINQLQEATD
jgi:hypothetical protein